MRTPAVVGTVLAAALLSGCGLQWTWNEVPVRAPVVTPAPATPEPDERSLHPYTGELGTKATCVTASEALRGTLEAKANVGGAVRYVQGVAVRSNATWWTVVVATAVDPHGSVDAATVAAREYFATNELSYAADDWEAETFTWSAGADTPSGRKALACLKRLPPAASPFTIPADTYTGRLAPGARCRAVSAKLLGRLQDVGQVGGAITYPRGRMVKANKAWWTVAVATRVNPNGDGYTRENVPATALFVTNAPTNKKNPTTFPVTGRKDAAARKALSCLKG